MTAFADLVLPDTTYLERHDVMSMLDRPISEFDGPVDSVRIPVVPPTGECKPFQEVLIELARGSKFPAFVQPDGTRKFRDYPDFIVNYETEPGSGIGFLVRLARQGRREVHARRAQPAAVGDVRAEQLRLPLQAAAVATSTCATGTRATSSGRSANRIRATPSRSSSTSTRRCCRSSASRRRARASSRKPPEHLRERIDDVLRPAAVLLRAARGAARPTCARYPLARGHAAADGDVPLVGLAERVAAPDPRAQLPVRQSGRRARARASRTAAGCGSSRPGARCAAWRATPRRSSPAPCGPGTRSARRRARGASRRTPTSRSAASCSTT